MTDAPVTEPQPILRIVNPDATPEEVAALVAVFASLGAPAPTVPRARSVWARPQLHPTIHHGQGAWRASGLPN